MEVTRDSKRYFKQKKKEKKTREKRKEKKRKRKEEKSLHGNRNDCPAVSFVEYQRQSAPVSFLPFPALIRNV